MAFGAEVFVNWKPAMETKSDEPKKKHVLIVEDEVDLALSYKELLEAHGFSVHTAPTGVIALKHILNKPVDAVICDLKLPQLEGDMFYITVERTKPQVCERFIFITGVADNPKFQPFINKMKGRVLLKPVGVEQLLQALNDLLKSTSPS
jgi:response regulator RpfG family c-di-GMP phosphodiesterase